MLKPAPIGKKKFVKKRKLGTFLLFIKSTDNIGHFIFHSSFLRWMAPEVIRHEPYSINSDIYSFGLVLWNLLSRNVPFDGMTPIQAAYAVAFEYKRPQMPLFVPEYIARIISSCWEQEQLKRPSFAQISLGLSKYACIVEEINTVGNCESHEDCSR